MEGEQELEAPPSSVQRQTGGKGEVKETGKTLRKEEAKPTEHVLYTVMF